MRAYPRGTGPSTTLPRISWRTPGLERKLDERAIRQNSALKVATFEYLGPYNRLAGLATSPEKFR